MTAVSTSTEVHFDGDALIAALDAKRSAQRLRWQQLAVTLWDQSLALNQVLGDAPLCPGALQRTAKRGTMSCQYALTLLRWIGRPPEDFLVGARADVGSVELLETDDAHRLRWDLRAIYDELSRRRNEEGSTWTALASELGVTANRLTNLKTARLADMDLVMRVIQRLGAPSSRFISATSW